VAVLVNIDTPLAVFPYAVVNAIAASVVVAVVDFDAIAISVVDDAIAASVEVVVVAAVFDADPEDVVVNVSAIIVAAFLNGFQFSDYLEPSKSPFNQPKLFLHKNGRGDVAKRSSQKSLSPIFQHELDLSGSILYDCLRH